MLFCIIYLGFNPRLATERNHSGENRIDKIVELITECQLSIHDLSRCQAQYEGEHFRLNMPLELGIDYGCKSFGKGMQKKSFLILEEQRYRYQAFISDLSGCDIESHNGDFQIAVRKVRNWLTSGGGAPKLGAAKITGAYYEFQEWNYETQLEAGFSEEDIQDYPTTELLAAMLKWVKIQKIK